MCLVDGTHTRAIRVIEDPERAQADPRFQARPRDAVVIEQRTGDGSWRTIRWIEARDGMVQWFPVDVDDDGTDEVTLCWLMGRGNEGTEVVTILRSRGDGWYEAFEVRSARPVSIAAPPRREHPPYGYVDREVGFGQDAQGRTVVVVKTTADIPEGTALLDATDIVEVARGVSVYRFDPATGGFALVGE